MGAKLLAELVVELVTVAMSFVDEQAAVGLMSLAARRQFAGVSAQPHGAALVGDRVLLIEHADHRVMAIPLKFRAVGVLEADDIAGELDDRALQAQADAE